jgi:hypothetical protein
MTEMSTNYSDTLILVSPDCPRSIAEIPEKAGSIAALQHELLARSPYAITSDDLLFEVYARRHEVAQDERAAARAAFFSKPQACLRCSPLPKQFGWGIHHDSDGHIALIAVESPEYARLSKGDAGKTVPAMRSKRARA